MGGERRGERGHERSRWLSSVQRQARWLKPPRHSSFIAYRHCININAVTQDGAADSASTLVLDLINKKNYRAPAHAHAVQPGCPLQDNSKKARVHRPPPVPPPRGHLVARVRWCRRRQARRQQLLLDRQPYEGRSNEAGPSPARPRRQRFWRLRLIQPRPREWLFFAVCLPRPCAAAAAAAARLPIPTVSHHTPPPLGYRLPTMLPDF